MIEKRGLGHIAFAGDVVQVNLQLERLIAADVRVRTVEGKPGCRDF